MKTIYFVFLVLISNLSFADYSASLEAKAYFAKEPYFSPYIPIQNTLNLFFDNSTMFGNC